ncbi:MAG TPA: SDR family oxidoreductase [Candidatus Limnocylindria bacterium]|jgi:NAD(P)-dependent dehydrogenase (short-subunit alcohol dehydrogenase family)|nr:SDR family oxidoreductase [Candidatus Limnocylindria bacterium]
MGNLVTTMRDRDGRARPIGKVAVITGASAGVGRATARRFAEQGWDVGLIARGRAGLEAAAAEVEAAGRRALIMQADVADAEAIDEAARAAEEQLGPVNVWVNNAMTSVFSPAIKMKPDEYRRVTEVTYLGVVYGTLAALRVMRPRDRGVIVQVGSALAYRAIPLQSAYCAAKHAIVGFTDSLRSELIHDASRISITHVHLPAINTPQFDWVRNRLKYRGQPVPPIYEPEVAAKAIVHAAEDPRREYLVGGETYKAIYGQKFLPGWLDRYLAAHAYDGQQTDEPEDPNRPDYLFASLDDDTDAGAHGRFSDEAADSSPALELSLRQREIATGAIAAVMAAVGVALLARRR